MINAFNTTCLIQPEEPAFEGLKNKFLAALVARNTDSARDLYKIIRDKAVSLSPDLQENHEKTLRQIQAAAKRFKKEFPALKDGYRQLQALLRGVVKTQSGSVRYISSDQWLEKQDLAPWQVQRLYETAITFQMTKGCSNFCRRCNEWALPKVRAHFTGEAVRYFLENFSRANNTDPALYGASDPLDWEDPPFGFDDILPKGEIPYSILTKVPKGKAGQLKRLIQHQVNFSVSLTSRNRARIKAIEQETGICLPKQHDTDTLLIPAGLDEDFTTVKPSITDAYGSEITPEGAFIIIPTFTSALYPMGHQKIEISGTTAFFPVRCQGRQALLKDYFKPLAVMGKTSDRFFLDHLLDVQVESILLDNGKDDLTPPGMRSVKEYFEIFDESPRIHRKAMTPAVVGKLKQAAIKNRGDYKRLSDKEKTGYRQHIKAHLDFTRKKPVHEAKVAAACFFLAAIRAYIQGHTAQKEIIAFLTRKEFGELKHQTPPDLDRLVEKGRANAWPFFRYHALSLVHGKNPGPVDRFVLDHPARFDPQKDRFTFF